MHIYDRSNIGELVADSGSLTEKGRAACVFYIKSIISGSKFNLFAEDNGGYMHLFNGLARSIRNGELSIRVEEDAKTGEITRMSIESRGTDGSCRRV